jgi:dinuclear metal center YbgI/SA1388 family protein
MLINEIVMVLEDLAPLLIQEPYDNAGLIVGDGEQEINAVLLCLDVTEDVLEEARIKGAGLVISHHPVIFGKLNKLTGETYTERVILSAVRNEIALYSAHTNLDNIIGGVNTRIAEKIGLSKTEILSPAKGLLRKLVVFVPLSHAAEVREAIFMAGAGHIGKYDQCSFNVAGEGSFRGSEDSSPFTGKPGSLHFEKELRVESIFPSFMEGHIIKKLAEAHPYEEVAYDIYPLENSYEGSGQGMMGTLDKPVYPLEFLGHLRDAFGSKSIRHTEILHRMISRVALCGGSGSFLTGLAKQRGADIFVSGDFKYHDFFQADEKMMIADIGHHESEQFTLEIFHELITKKFPNFAVHFSDVNTNPIHYF